MVPAGEITERTVAALADALEPGDTIVDGGNTRYHDDIRRAAALAEKGIHYVDCGTSGGVFGLERGYCLMLGGEARPSAVSPRSSRRSRRASPRRRARRVATGSRRPRSRAGCTAARPGPATS